MSSPSTGERVYDRGPDDEDGPGRAYSGSSSSSNQSRPTQDYGYSTSTGGSSREVGEEYDPRHPILLDLSGSGIEITQLSQSTVFMDATGDGLLNRTAWAAEGNGVLFYDPDNTGEISETRQYVFTEWDPTATSDIEALRSVFDSNGDGAFDAWGSRTLTHRRFFSAKTAGSADFHLSCGGKSAHRGVVGHLGLGETGH